MKQATQIFPLAALLAIRASGQVVTVTQSPTNTGAVTQYFSICPTSSTTTVTVSTTTTICPGPQCGGTTTVFYDAQPITTVGPDGKTTIYEDIHYTAPCPCDGGVCDAVYTITRECPCTAAHNPTAVPSGFTATAVACNACAQNGGPSTVTVITPIATGPWASQTPVMGAPYNGASASAAASAYASAGPNGAVAGAGANAAASAGNGYASANSNANASAAVNGGNSSASANANANANVGAGKNAPVLPNPAYGSGSNSSGISASGMTPPITPYVGAANRGVYAFSAIFAGFVGSMALLL